MRGSLFLILFLTTIRGTTIGQDSIFISGHIKRLTNGSGNSIAGPVDFSGVMNAAGVFKFADSIADAGEALVSTDSSFADAVWLEPGTYTLYLREAKIQGLAKVVLRTDSLQGPQDAMIYHSFTQRRYLIGGVSKDDIREKHRQFSIQFIDSVFLNVPGSRVLPVLIRLSKEYIGDQQTATYMAMLNQVQKNSDQATQLRDYFQRKEKLEKEVLFEDFKMRDQKGKNFRLSSVKAKLILLDFWSSSCYPCRKQHEKFVELYNKYHKDGLEIVSISMDDNRNDWLKAVTADKMRWINVSDLKGWHTPLAVRYFITINPFTLWLDGDRKVIGEKLDEDAIRKILKIRS